MRGSKPEGTGLGSASPAHEAGGAGLGGAEAGLGETGAAGSRSAGQPHISEALTIVFSWFRPEPPPQNRWLGVNQNQNQNQLAPACHNQRWFNPEPP